MRTATHQYLNIKTRENGKVLSIRGQTERTQGRTSTLSVNGPMKGSSIVSIYTIGKEAPTTSEILRSNILLRILQRTDDIMSHPFVQRIWLPSEKISWPAVSSLAPLTLYFPSKRTLNVSQERAVNLVLSRKHKDRVALIHGPPGTGKTTVIAASVTSVMASAGDKTTIWLVAQSNVAVKNIAEKLMELKFTKFRILVSKDFHFEWHEHLYGKINKNLIRSDDFDTDSTTASRQLLDSRVVLCTLSMMSHERLMAIAKIVPPELIIFDEASQIEIGDYFPLISRFRNSINKLVFIGDDKQ
ncbi:hypothetical protein K443DRAFT_137429 [Laccaria amethystina LaAM-08-1]|uniref:DNA2/NAM7 helicase helicase domain-containing protein n=1 Tax=Laccaria amethystina LaAM-08-1 TaxID=1095629 RepID=A0A0C9Y7R4_9AGAR|nr:hypothetical protein K443DRAFT_137429 [Laccaria amethystina LaAM-08-1]